MTSLIWLDVKVKAADESSECMLLNISGMVSGGEIMSIMGLRGSGKSQLLQVLAGKSRHKVFGSVYLNDELQCSNTCLKEQLQQNSLSRKVTCKRIVSY